MPHRIAAAVTVVSVVLLSTIDAAPRRECRFHHLHLVEGRDFYARLFDRTVTQETTIAGFHALRSGPMLLLFGRPAGIVPMPERSSAIWHFGWGEVVIGETYLRHAAQEVDWEPPLPARKLHLHLVSPSPARAADWYRSVLGAAVDVLPDAANDRRVAARPELRIAEAAVRLGDFAMLIHRTDEALATTRGQRTDHIAFECDEFDAALRDLQDVGVLLLEAVSPFGDGRHAMIEGPDRIAIELVESGSGLQGIPTSRPDE